MYHFFDMNFSTGKKMRIQVAPVSFPYIRSGHKHCSPSHIILLFPFFINIIHSIKYPVT